MKNLGHAFALFVMFSFAGIDMPAEVPSKGSTEGISDLESLVLINNELGLELYHLINQREENLVFSPYSLSIGLQMLYAGTAGITQSQMARVLHYTFAPQKLHQAASALAEELATTDRRTLDALFLVIANSLWVQVEHPILPDFVKSITDSYKGVVKDVDFSRKASAVRIEINEWVKAQTNGKIVDLLSQGEISAITRMVLVSTLYMHGKWQHIFDPILTRLTPFFPYPSKTITVPMMSMTTDLPYLKEKNFAMVELAYATKAPAPKLAMFIILPHETFGLKEVENSLSAQQLLGLMRRLKPARLTVSVPKFKLSKSLDFKSLLEKMGLTAPFSSRADFSAIDGTQNLVASNVLQKVFISVDENGTEAGVATAIPFGLKAFKEPTPELFLADHPFLFFVVDKLTGTFLLIGRVVQPN